MLGASHGLDFSIPTFGFPLNFGMERRPWLFPRRTRQRLKFRDHDFRDHSKALRHRSLGPALIKDASAQSIMCATLPCSPGSLCWGSGKQGCRFSCTSSNLGNARTRSFSSLGNFAESRRKFGKKHNLGVQFQLEQPHIPTYGGLNPMVNSIVSNL